MRDLTADQLTARLLELGFKPAYEIPAVMAKVFKHGEASEARFFLHDEETRRANLARFLAELRRQRGGAGNSDGGG